MADRIACSCVTCPKCGTWVVVKQRSVPGATKEKFRAKCPVPECGKEFEFEAGETRLFEVPLPLFERRHFYRSELSLRRQNVSSGFGENAAHDLPRFAALSPCDVCGGSP